MALPTDLAYAILLQLPMQIIGRCPTVIVRRCCEKRQPRSAAVAPIFASPYLTPHENWLKLAAWAGTSFPAAQCYLPYGLTALNAILANDLPTFQSFLFYSEDHGWTLPLLLRQRARGSRIATKILEIFLDSPFNYQSEIFRSCLAAGDFTLDRELLQLCCGKKIGAELDTILEGAGVALGFPYPKHSCENKFCTASPYFYFQRFAFGYIMAGGNNVEQLESIATLHQQDLHDKSFQLSLVLSPVQFGKQWIDEITALQQLAYFVVANYAPARIFPPQLDMAETSFWCSLVTDLLQQRASMMSQIVTTIYLPSPALERYQELLQFFLAPESTNVTTIPAHFLVLFGRSDLLTQVPLSKKSLYIAETYQH